MINHYLSILTDELRAEGVADPLAQPFTLAALWDDLAAMAAEAPPAAVRRYLAGDADESETSLPEGASPALDGASRATGEAVNVGA